MSPFCHRKSMNRKGVNALIFSNRSISMDFRSHTMKALQKRKQDKEEKHFLKNSFRRKIK